MVLLQHLQQKTAALSRPLFTLKQKNGGSLDAASGLTHFDQNVNNNIHIANGAEVHLQYVIDFSRKRHLT